MTYFIVHFHADGGQACVPGRRVFLGVDAAARFAEMMFNEAGHTCEGSVRIELSRTNPGDEGKIYPEVARL